MTLIKKLHWGKVIPLALITMIGIFFSISAFAAEPSVWEPPIWAKPVIDMILGVPTVGPIILGVLKWAGVAAALMTAISGGLTALTVTLKGVGDFAGWANFSTKVQAFYDKIYPFVAWFSMFNVQKKK